MRPNYRIHDLTGGGTTEDIYAESLEEAISQGREWIAGGWDRTIYDQTLACSVGPIIYDEDGVEDDDATEEAKAYDCSAYLEPAAPKPCPVKVEGADEDDLDEFGYLWMSPYKVVGGCRTNPGVWGSGHGQVSSRTVCGLSGWYRTTDDGATDPETGEQASTIEYEEPDKTSVDWLVGRWSDDDGKIPPWLSEYLSRIGYEIEQ